MTVLRSEKERVVAELAERLRSAQTLMVADYRGLSMSEIDELRTRLLEAGARFTVVKNTLTKLAAEAAGTKDVLELIEGPTAIAFLDADGDQVAVAKVLNETARARDVLVIRGGILDGSLVGDADIKRLATLPPAEVLRAQLVGAVAGPLTTVVGLFTAPLRDLVGVIDARIRQLEEQGEAVPEPAEPEPEAAAEEEPQPEEPPAEAEASAEEAPAAEEKAEEPQAEAPAGEEPVAEGESEQEQPDAGDSETDESES
jgi:large subunit ribosomal protein L10